MKFDKFFSALYIQCKSCMGYGLLFLLLFLSQVNMIMLELLRREAIHDSIAVLLYKSI